MVRRWWWMILPPIAIAVGAAVALTGQMERVYAAEAEVLIRTEESANLFPLSDSAMLLRSPSAEEGFLASTDFEQAAMEAAGSENPVTIDVGDVSSRVEPSFISFEARENDPVLAAAVAQAWADTYIVMRHELDTTDLNRTMRTLDLRLSDLDAERSEYLAPVAALDAVLQQTNDAVEVARLASQRLVLLQSVESNLEPIEAQAKLVRDELAELRLVHDFLGSQHLSAKVNRTAEIPDSAVSPSLMRNVLAALAVALVAGAMAMLLAESLDDRVRTSRDITRRFGLQSLASVPHVRRDDGSPIVAPGPVAESFLRLASAIDFAGVGGSEAKVLMFTSSRSSESKTSTVGRLGTTLARQGRRTLLIGADLRLPTLAARFDHTKGPGLGELLGGLYRASGCIVEVPNQEGLFLLRAGTNATESSPVDLFRNASFGQLVDSLRDEYDHILIDCPPVLPVVDALEVAKVSDAVVLNVFAGRSRLSHVDRALSMIVQASRIPILGFVLTGAKGEVESYRGDYYAAGGRTIELLDLRREATARTNAADSIDLEADSIAVNEIATVSNPMPAPLVESARTMYGPQGSTNGQPIDQVEFDLVGTTHASARTVFASTGKEQCT